MRDRGGMAAEVALAAFMVMPIVERAETAADQLLQLAIERQNQLAGIDPAAAAARLNPYFEEGSRLIADEVIDVLEELERAGVAAASFYAAADDAGTFRDLLDAALEAGRMEVLRERRIAEAMVEFHRLVGQVHDVPEKLSSDLRDQLRNALQSEADELRRHYREALGPETLQALREETERVWTTTRVLVVAALILLAGLVSFAAVVWSLRERIFGAETLRRVEELKASLTELLSESDAGVRTDPIRSYLAERFDVLEHRLDAVEAMVCRDTDRPAVASGEIESAAAPKLGESLERLGRRIAQIEAFISDAALLLPVPRTASRSDAELLGAWIRTVGAVRALAPEGGLGPLLRDLYDSLSRELKRAAGDPAPGPLLDVVASDIMRLEEHASQREGSEHVVESLRQLRAAIERFDGQERGDGQ